MEDWYSIRSGPRASIATYLAAQQEMPGQTRNEVAHHEKASVGSPPRSRSSSDSRSHRSRAARSRVSSRRAIHVPSIPNGDGVHTAADVLHGDGSTVVDIWLDIAH